MGVGEIRDVDVVSDCSAVGVSKSLPNTAKSSTWPWIAIIALGIKCVSGSRNSPISPSGPHQRLEISQRYRAEPIGPAIVGEDTFYHRFEAP